MSDATWMPTWTNYGSFSLPTIRASDLGYYETTFGGPSNDMGDYSGPSTDPITLRNYQLNGDVYGGLAGDSRNAFNSWSNNYAVQQNGTDDWFDVLVKSADKEGTRIRYNREGDYWVPTQNLGTQGWNTNRMEPADWLRAGTALLAPYAIGTALTAAGAGTAAGAAGAGQTMTTYGVLDTAAALPGTQFAPFAGAAPSPMTTWGTIDKSVALPGTKFVEGGASSLIPEGLRQVWDKIPPAMQSQLIKGGMTLAGGLLGQSGSDGGGSGGSGSSGPRSIAPAITPTMYGGNNAPPTFQQQGNTETERRMTQQYLPSLFQQQNSQQPQAGLLGPMRAFAGSGMGAAGNLGGVAGIGGLLGGMAGSAQQQQPGMTTNQMLEALRTGKLNPAGVY